MANNDGTYVFPESVVAEAAAYINAHLVGKVIESAEESTENRPVKVMRIRFTDGTAVLVMSQYTEGWTIEADE